LDLVLNDFVAGAVAEKKLSILSDGTPWRAMVHVKDMSRAMEWAITRESTVGGDFLAINIGSNEWNHQVKTMAEAVTKLIPEVTLTINKDAPADKRSYKVNFDLFESLAPNHQPQFTLEKSIKELESGLRAMGFSDSNFRNSTLVRLMVLNNFQEKNILDNSLEWVK
jgi:nucleoside-diphosphate-sugar epimerase